MFNLSFSHYHNCMKFSKSTNNSEFYFIPFAFDKNKFNKIDKNIEKKYDIGFSGIVQNINRNSGPIKYKKTDNKKTFFLFNYGFTFSPKKTKN